MSDPLTAAEVMDREFLELRAKILELAASFDRLQRADGDVSGDPRLTRIHEAIEILQIGQDDRAEQVQLLFSRLYEDDWQNTFDMSSR